VGTDPRQQDLSDPSLQQRGKALGIVRMDDSLAELVRAGKTSLETARDYADSPDQLEAVVSGRPLRPLDPAALPGNPFNAAEASREAAQAAQKLGKDVLSKAGRFFGGDKK
jgi:twitching motility protein PilT